MSEGFDVLRAAIARAGEVGGHGISPEQQITLLNRLQVAEAVHDELAAVCDAYGLPHSAAALDRHLTANAGLTIEIWKMNVDALNERIQAAQAELSDTSRNDALRMSRAMIVLGAGGVALLAAVDADKAAGAHHD